MTKFWKLLLITIWIVILTIIFWVKLWTKNTETRLCKNALASSYNEQSGMLQQIDELSQQISWLQNTGVADVPAFEIPAEVSTVLNYPNQPAKAVGTYEGNTTALNLYSSRTRQTAHIDQSYKGEIIVHLRKTPTIHTIVYFKTNGIYCGGRLNEQIDENNDFVLSMDGFKVGKVNCILRNSDWTLPETISVGGYVANFEGNGIETITFK